MHSTWPENYYWYYLSGRRHFCYRSANFPYNPSLTVSPASPPFVDAISGKLQGKPPLTSPSISYKCSAALSS